MRLLRAFVALGLIAAPLAAQAAPDSPEAVAQRYVAAMRGRDWKAMAALMHPQALAKFRSMVGAAMHDTDAAPIREQLFSGATPAQLDSMTDVDFYARFIAAAMGADPELQTMMDSAHVNILGHVAETPEITHVVFTMRLAIGPVSVSKPDVLTLRRQGSKWLALLRADMEIMAAALEQRFRS